VSEYLDIYGPDYISILLSNPKPPK